MRTSPLKAQTSARPVVCSVGTRAVAVATGRARSGVRALYPVRVGHLQAPRLLFAHATLDQSHLYLDHLFGFDWIVV